MRRVRFWLIVRIGLAIRREVDGENSHACEAKGGTVVVLFVFLMVVFELLDVLVRRFVLCADEGVFLFIGVIVLLKGDYFSVR